MNFSCVERSTASLYVAVKSWGLLPSLSQEQGLHGCRASPSTGTDCRDSWTNLCSWKSSLEEPWVLSMSKPCSALALLTLCHLPWGVMCWLGAGADRQGMTLVLHPSYGIQQEILEFPELMNNLQSLLCSLLKVLNWLGSEERCRWVKCWAEQGWFGIHSVLYLESWIFFFFNFTCFEMVECWGWWVEWFGGLSCFN